MNVGCVVQAISKNEMLEFVSVFKPINYPTMVDGHDTSAPSDADRRELLWIRRAVEEEGLVIIMVGGMSPLAVPITRLRLHLR